MTMDDTRVIHLKLNFVQAEPELPQIRPRRPRPFLHGLLVQKS